MYVLGRFYSDLRYEYETNLQKPLDEVLSEENINFYKDFIKSFNYLLKDFKGRIYLAQMSIVEYGHAFITYYFYARKDGITDMNNIEKMINKIDDFRKLNILKNNKNKEEIIEFTRNIFLKNPENYKLVKPTNPFKYVLSSYTRESFLESIYIHFTLDNSYKSKNFIDKTIYEDKKIKNYILSYGLLNGF